MQRSSFSPSDEADSLFSDMLMLPHGASEQAGRSCLVLFMLDVSTGREYIMFPILKSIVFPGGYLVFCTSQQL